MAGDDPSLSAILRPDESLPQGCYELRLVLVPLALQRTMGR
jgi:hypothetical protein